MEIKNNLTTAMDPYGAKVGAANKEKNALAQDAAVKSAGRLGDRVSLSPEAKLMMVAQQAMTTAPDVRADKVAELKSKVESGTYVADSQKIATSLLGFDKAMASSFGDDGE